MGEEERYFHLVYVFLHNLFDWYMALNWTSHVLKMLIYWWFDKKIYIQ